MQNTKIKQYRQGDVFIEEVDKVPSDAIKQPKASRIVLAYGEATGHHHSLDIDGADWWKRGEEEQFIETLKPARIVHQEHDSIALKAGKKYRVTVQREYSPAEIRRVQD